MNDSVTKDGVVKLPNGGWTYSEEAYTERWLKRLRARTVVNENGCFVWQGPVSSKGYIMLAHRKWKAQGHRNVYRIVHGVELTPDQQVCHKCDNRRCWNPEHLWLGTNKDNHLDKDRKGRNYFSNQTHCKRGHPFTPENTYIKKPHANRGPARTCKTCQRERQQRYAQEKAA